MENETGTPDPSTGTDTPPSEPSEETVDSLKESNTALEEKNKQLFARAKKAEGFIEKDGEWIKEEKPPVEDKPPADKSEGLNEGQIALLTVQGFNHEEDVAFIEGEMKDSGKDFTDVLNMKYVKEELKEKAEARKLADATPEGSKRSHASAKDQKAYWIAKNEMPPNTPENTQLRRDIVNARIETEKSGNKFSSNSLIT